MTVTTKCAEVGNSEATSLTVDEVRIHYGGVRAVDGISLSVEGERTYGLLGPNGSGKSTLLAAISRLVNLTSGTLVFNGRAYDKTPAQVLPSWGFARTFQTVRLVPDLTVEENVLIGAGVRSGTSVDGVAGLLTGRRRDMARRARRAIELTGLMAHRRKRPGELSYGVQRRVEIARAVATEPRLLLLDEPVAGMNRAERRNIVDLLGQLRTEGITQVLVEHDVQVLVDSCDYVYAMNFGKLIAQGSPHEVVQDAVVQEAYLGRNRSRDA
jgi:branched-chain amino acid transport system ATP-binding protein